VIYAALLKIFTADNDEATIFLIPYSRFDRELHSSRMLSVVSTEAIAPSFAPNTTKPMNLLHGSIEEAPSEPAKPRI
jgi:hypothetical protein